MLWPVVKTVAKKESGLAAKVGFARLSKTVYNVASDNDIVVVFKGITKMGELDLRWNTEKKPGIFIAKADLDKISIRDGDAVCLVLIKK